MRRGFSEAVESAVRAQEFDVQEGDFSVLEIRPGGGDSQFHYFYDRSDHRLVKDFRIAETSRVVTLCRVTLIRVGDRYTPRLRFWKRDKGKYRDSTSTEEIVSGDSLALAAKASVDTADGYDHFWVLIAYLQSLSEISTSDASFRAVDARSGQLADLLLGRDRVAVLEAMDTFFQGNLTKGDIELLTKRREQLDYFRRLLEYEDFFESEKNRKGKRSEALWQDFFDANSWIFGYGLNLISSQSFNDARLEQVTTGHSLFQGAGKRSDGVLRSRGLISSLLFCEIKTHLTPLLERLAYRPPDVYQVSGELSGAISQVQKTADKALRMMAQYVESHFEPDGTPTAIEFSTVRPKQVVLIGSLKQLIEEGGTNPERLSSFEFYRRGIMDVEIITFDELYQRARFIVEDV